MNAINRLKRDHGIFRTKLAVVESALGLGVGSWFVLREISFTLAKQLQAHRQREEQLLNTCRAVGSPEPFARVVVDHTCEQEDLKAINLCFMQQPRCSLETVRPMLTRLTDRWRRHMEQQESHLFPTIEDLLVLHEVAGQKEPPVPSGLSETMTVREVLRRHPIMRGVFRGLFIDSRYEGYDCLDEVAWRHGMEIRELLSRLETRLAGLLPQAA